MCMKIAQAKMPLVKIPLVKYISMQNKLSPEDKKKLLP